MSEEMSINKNTAENSAHEPLRTAVRRVNEWDGPSMLKVYSAYTGTTCAPEAQPPKLPDYVQRIDKYTYGLGWLLCELNNQTAGFCHLTENRHDPENLFSVEFQLYVREGLHRKGIGLALWSLMRDMMEVGSRREVFSRVHKDNLPALKFFHAMGFSEDSREEDLIVLRYELTPEDKDAQRPTKPYLIDKFDYEPARERAAKLVKTDLIDPALLTP